MSEVCNAGPDVSQGQRHTDVLSGPSVRALLNNHNVYYLNSRRTTSWPIDADDKGPCPMQLRLTSIARAAPVLAAAALSGCGLTYNAQSVRASLGGDVPVQIVQVTPQSVLIANSEPHTPRSLPASFLQQTGLGAGLGGAGALPDAPGLPDLRPATAQLRPPPPVSPQPYRLGVGDVLLLSAPQRGGNVEQLSGLLAAQNQRQGYTVRDDGAIAIPEVGTIPLAGLTVEQAENRIFDELVQSQLDPTFSLEVAEFNSQRVSVGGAVATTQFVPIGLTVLTLDDAITAAGGITAPHEEFATIRLYRDGTLYEIPLDAYLTRPDLRRTTLVDGDSVFVDTTYDLAEAQTFYEQRINAIGLERAARAAALTELQTEVELRRAALDEDRDLFERRLRLDAIARDYVFLAGEVATQSRVPLPFGQQTHLADVLYDAGGIPAASGNPAQIYVLRAADDAAALGAVTAWNLDARNAAAITLATRFEMRPNDIVFVAPQPITTWNRALQQFFPPLVDLGASAAN